MIRETIIHWLAIIVIVACVIEALAMWVRTMRR